MVPTTKEEIWEHVHQYKETEMIGPKMSVRRVKGSFSSYDENLSHAARYWIIVSLINLYPSLKYHRLAHHYNMSRRLFDKNRLKNITMDIPHYQFLSPGEVAKGSKRHIIMTYGRKEDIEKYEKMKEKEQVEMKKKGIKQ